MRPNPLLSTWAAIVAQPVIGQVGHHLTQPAGAAHPAGHAPAWVTARGCDLAKLHAAYCATVAHDRRGEARECHALPAQRRKIRKRTAKPTPVVLKLAARRSA